MAMMVPVISTSMACEGLYAESEHHLLIADIPGEFAEGIFRLFEDEKLRDTITKNAYKLVKEKFSWDKLSLDLEKIYGNTDRKI